MCHADKGSVRAALEKEHQLTAHRENAFVGFNLWMLVCGCLYALAPVSLQLSAEGACS